MRQYNDLRESIVVCDFMHSLCELGFTGEHGFVKIYIQSIHILNASSLLPF